MQGHKRGPMLQVHWVKRKAFGADPEQLAGHSVSHSALAIIKLMIMPQYEEPVSMYVFQGLQLCPF